MFELADGYRGLHCKKQWTSKNPTGIKLRRGKKNCSKSANLWHALNKKKKYFHSANTNGLIKELFQTSQQNPSGNMLVVDGIPS